MEEKVYILNRKKQKLALIIDRPLKQKGLAFVMHGLGGYKEQAHLKIIAETFKAKNFIVVRFDVANSIGESEGTIDKAKASNYYSDLEDVIKWSKKQDWYKEPFALCGHSLGGVCTAIYAQKHQNEVCLLVPVATVVSGKLVIETNKLKNSNALDKIQQISWLSESVSDPRKFKKLAYAFFRDFIKFDLLRQVANLTMPVLLIVGDKDTTTPKEHVEILYQALPEPKEMCIIKEATHSFNNEKHLKELKNILSSWIKKYAQA